jgi:hypothetical protein
MLFHCMSTTKIVMQHLPRMAAVRRPGRARTRHQGSVMTITSYDGRTGRANGTVEEISPHDFWTVVERTASASSAVTAASLR